MARIDGATIRAIRGTQSQADFAQEVGCRSNTVSRWERDDREPARYGELMRNVIALNASFHNSQRMVEEYAIRAWS